MTAQQIVQRSYKVNKEILKKKLRDAVSDVHLALDCWSGRPGVDHYHIKLRSGIPLTHPIRVLNKAPEPRDKPEFSSLIVVFDRSAPNRKSFLVVVTHFVDDRFNLRKALLSLKYLLENTVQKISLIPSTSILRILFEARKQCMFCLFVR